MTRIRQTLNKATGSFSFIAVLPYLLIVACSQQALNLEEYIAVPSVATLQERIADYTEWDAQIRVAMRHDKWSWRGTIQWMQHEGSFRMIFNDLFGRRMMLIESLEDGGVIATDAKGRREQASDASVLMKSILGREVPLGNLYYWLLGAPTPKEAYSKLKFNEQGLLQSYEQNAWTISYTAYRQDDCLGEMPSNLNLVQGSTQLWLHIRSWQMPQHTIKTSACKAASYEL